MTEQSSAIFDTNVVDEGLLCVNVKDDLDCEKVSSEDYLRSCADSACARLLTKLKELDGKLPRVRTKLMREKKLPQAKKPTKWDKFANEKGIKKQKRDKLVYDEVSGEWKRRYGYGGINQENPQEDWLIEIKDNEPNVEQRDFFAEKRAKSKELQAKYEYKHLKNMAAHSRLDLTQPKLLTTEKRQQRKELAIAARSDASMGKFSQRLKSEVVKSRGFRAKQQMSNDSISAQEEKLRNLKILDEVTGESGARTTKRVVEAKAESMVARKIAKNRERRRKR